MNKSTSVQTGLPGITNKPAQAKMFEEFGTAPGTGGKKDTLIDAEKLKRRLVIPPGQHQLITGETTETDVTIIAEGV